MSRLIDADELKKALAEMWYESAISITGLSVAELIDNAPTIEPSKLFKEFYEQGKYDAEVDRAFAEPSGDLISRADAIESVRKVVIDNDVVRVLSALPSADRPKGEWIENDALGWKCSRCGVITNLTSHYCPCCGAEMRDVNYDCSDSKPQPYVPEASTERVVHCKDCVYSRQPEGEKLFLCENRFGMSGWVREDEFCSSGSL